MKYGRISSTVEFLDSDVPSFTWDVSILNETEDLVGSAKILVYDAYNFHVSDLRSEADNYQYHTYQSLSSVRIFATEYEMDAYTQDGEEYDDSGFDHFGDPEDSDSIGSLEGKEYNTLTANVWGNVAILDEIRIDSNCRGKGFGTLAMNEILSLLKRTGVNYIILKPWPLENIDMKQEVLEQNIMRLITFYKRFDFSVTIGRSSDVHMFKMIAD